MVILLSQSSFYLSWGQSIAIELSLPAIFSDNMVFQQNEEVAIWGKAKKYEVVRVVSSWGESVLTKTDEHGNWKVQMLTPSASFNPQSIQISSETKQIQLSNVLIGEVWLCSGQSNMAFQLTKEDNGIQEIQNAHKLTLRLFNIPSYANSYPLQDLERGKWRLCDSNSVYNFSALGYYFGKILQKKLKNTPIAIINASFGGATIEAFMSKEALLSKTFLAEHFNNYSSIKPSKNPSWCYNAMIHPLVDYRIAGVAWYQGESNCQRASHYYEALKTMIKSWRTEFKSQNLPFFVIQLPAYDYSLSQQEKGDNYSAATLREAQLKVSKELTNCRLVITLDVGDIKDIHPTNKKIVGERLAKMVLNEYYGFKDLAYAGPQFRSYIIENNAIRLTFDNVENGIKETHGELSWFIIAGEDKKFYQGNAFIKENKVVVSSPFVANPKAIRFAWHNAAKPNFYNKEGFPASSFRTDDWTNFTYVKGIENWSNLPDIRNKPFDLSLPLLQDVEPAAGKRVKQSLAGYEETEVYHTLYLPKNWEEDKKYPVIVEYPGNGPFISKFGDHSSGKVEDTYLGYGISGGKDFIWVSMPLISADGKTNQDYWWGDIEASVKYTIYAVKNICENYGGDTSLVFISGFSRGAIACNYIGLHNDDIAKLWCGSIANSHYDGMRTNWGYPDCDEVSAKRRLERLKGRPQIIIQEKNESAKTKKYIENTAVQGDFTYLDIPYRNHTLRWVLQDIPQRQFLRDWVTKIVRSKN